jgi:hypothetical protein
VINFEKSKKISLVKKREEKIDIVLKKKNVFSPLMSRVGLVMDISGSMRSLYKNGIVQDVIEKIYPLATKFDDDGLLDMWVFATTHDSLPAVSQENFDTYVQKEILDAKPSCSWGQTKYAPVMYEVNDFYKDSKVPAFVIFITDGANSDKRMTEDILRKSSGNPIFWQYVGIGKEKFKFLEKLDELSGRYIDNANFFQLNDIATVSDDELYDRLLNEFPEWINEARRKNIL